MSTTKKSWLRVTPIRFLMVALLASIVTFAIGKSPLAKMLHLEPRSPKVKLFGRTRLDTSGLNNIFKSLPGWPGNATLEQIRDIWKGNAQSQINAIDQHIAQNNSDPAKTINLLFVKVSLQMSDGKPEEAYKTLTKIREISESNDSFAAQSLANVMFFMGVASLRLGENENCILCRGESSCILPISPAAVHTNPKGSRQAIKHFTEYLENFPEDLEAKWLLNVAHMTLGEYPDKVDPKYLVNIDHYLKSEVDIGKFRDIGDSAGINRLNQAGGSIIDDFDNDGLLDFIVTSIDCMENAHFYRNKGDGTFEDKTVGSGLENQYGGLMCSQADYNNDGKMDFFVTRGAWFPYPIRTSLLRNDGNGKFTDVSREAKTIDAVNSNSICWADYDNDGFVDYYVCCERQLNRLFRNKGDGTFEEVSGRANAQGTQLPMCKGATWIDYDNDNYPDLFLNYLSGNAALYHNNRNGTFTNVTQALGIDGPYGGFSCWAWDFDNDGWTDIWATCYDRQLKDIVLGLMGKPHTLQSNRLFKNMQGKGFKDVTKEVGLDSVFATMGSNFGDFDNDGFLDMYLGTGDPDIATLIPNRMIKNLGGKRFVDITASSRTGILQKGHSVACGDWDRDGNVDIFIQMGGAVDGDKYHNVLFQNPGHANSWITVKVVGTKTNRAGIGARIKVVTDGKEPMTVHRIVSSGSSFGANSLEQTIGLAKAQKIAALEVHWPTSDTTQVFRNLDVNQAIEITEGKDAFRKLDYKPISHAK